MGQKAVELIGRAIGVLAGSLVAGLWVLAIWLPESGEILSGINFVVALLMALIALFAAIASVRGHATVLAVAFVASYFPVGLHLTGADHWLSWVGRLDLCYLVAAALLLLGRRGGESRAPT